MSHTFLQREKTPSWKRIRKVKGTRKSKTEKEETLKNTN